MSAIHTPILQTRKGVARIKHADIPSRQTKKPVSLAPDLSTNLLSAQFDLTPCDLLHSAVCLKRRFGFCCSFAGSMIVGVGL